MARTENIGLNLTEDESTRFWAWRKSIDGVGDDNNKSNMQIIDKAIGQTRQDISNTNGALTQIRKDISTAFESLDTVYGRINEVERDLGSIDTALDNIIAIQNSLIGGEV